MMQLQVLLVSLALLVVNYSHGFTMMTPRSTQHYVSMNSLSSVQKKHSLFQKVNIGSTLLFAENDTSDVESSTTSTKLSLEEKMKKWDNTAEEKEEGKQPKRADGFDIGLFIAFPIIVGTSLFFAIFPFIMDKIDVSSVGPPPTV